MKNCNIKVEIRFAPEGPSYYEKLLQIIRNIYKK